VTLGLAVAPVGGAWIEEAGSPVVEMPLDLPFDCPFCGMG
jgi:hypothetical protein